MPDGLSTPANAIDAEDASAPSSSLAAADGLRALLLACIAVALALALTVALPARAQSTAENLEKYHALRARLLSEFTVVGEEQGQSQPADVRDDGEGFIKWSDSTIRLGWYIGVLATEHHLYTHPDLYPGAAAAPPEATLDELYDALLALERLDIVADAAFPPPCTQTQSLNGFFLRDDVPAGFHQSFAPLTTTYSNKPEVWYLKGMADAEAGDAASAANAFRKALAANPGYTIARQALLRHEQRSGNLESAAGIAAQVLRDDRYDMAAWEVTADGLRARGQADRARQLLVTLASQPQRIMTREELFAEVWGSHPRPEDRSVDVYISRLRAKLGAALPGMQLIHTHNGIGYRFSPDG